MAPKFPDWDQQTKATGDDISAKVLKTGISLLITGGTLKITQS